MQDILGAPQDFNLLSLNDLLQARELFHRHLINKRHVVATAIGKYLIRKDDPWPSPDRRAPRRTRGPREARRLDNAEVRPYSWPCILVFVDRWQTPDRFSGEDTGRLSASDMVPSALYMPDGSTVPLCVVSLEEGPRPAPPAADLRFAPSLIGGGYPVTVRTQERERVGSIACLVTDGHLVYALTNRHVVGEPGTAVFTEVNGERVEIGRAAAKQLTKEPFTTVYPSLPGQRVMVNLDVGLIQVHDLNRWTAQVYGIGEMGPLADLNAENVSLRLIGAYVRAHGAVSGPLAGQIDALFYRYKSVGGFEYIADFLIGPRSVDGVTVQTLPGDSGTLWLLEPPPPQPDDDEDDGQGADADRAVAERQAAAEDQAAWAAAAQAPDQAGQAAQDIRPDPVKQADPVQTPDPVEYLPLAVQWGGEVVLGARDSSSTYILASALSTTCRLLDIDVIRDWNVGLPEYWGARGHYTVASLAVDLLGAGKLRTLMQANLANIGYPRDQLRRTSSGYDADGFVRLADVADLTWKDKSPAPGPFNRLGRENPNHFADIDQPRPSDGKTLLDLCAEDPMKNVKVDVWLKHYQAAGVRARNRGILPFRVQQIYQEMVRSVKAGDAVRYVCAAGILAHYVGDACQPLHCSFKSDGIPLTDDPDGPKDGEGVHGPFEGAMIDSGLSMNRPASEHLVHRLPARLDQLKPRPPKVKGGPAAARSMVDLMRATFTTLPPDEVIRQFKKDGSAPKMWDVLGDKTVTVMARGIQYLAMLWESAWIEGKGDTTVTKLGAISHADLRKLYETNNPKTEFLPSRTIQEIKTVLV